MSNPSVTPTVPKTSSAYPNTICSGSMSISNCGAINFKNCTLIDEGVLNLDGLVIKANEPLEPSVKEYLERLGGTITQEDEKTVLKGKFYVDRAEAKAKFPSMYGKYEGFKDGRVSSKSKVSGTKKIWISKPISSEYTLDKAIADLFKGTLMNKAIKCDFIPKTKLDVFSKAIVSREFAQNNECNLKADFNTKRNHNLEKYIYTVLTTKDIKDINVSLNKPMLPKIEPEEGVLSFWLSSGLKLFFSAPAKADENLTKKDTHQYTLDHIPNDISKPELIDAINEAINLISQDDFIVCNEIKESIVKDLSQEYCKFTQKEIDDAILPEVDSSISNIKLNVASAAKYIEKLELETITKPALTLVK